MLKDKKKLVRRESNKKVLLLLFTLIALFAAVLSPNGHGDTLAARHPPAPLLPPLLLGPAVPPGHLQAMGLRWDPPPRAAVQYEGFVRTHQPRRARGEVSL